jgi:hypothetical protein
MITEQVVTKPIQDGDVIKAICLRSSACFGTLLMLRSIGGDFNDPEWYLAKKYTLKELIDEADRRNLDLATSVTAVEQTPLSIAMKYRHARGEVTDSELERWWRAVKAGEIEP